MQIGYFHQKILTSVRGYIDLDDEPKLKKEYRVDIVNREKHIYIELKNKYNTMNCASKYACVKRLLDIMKKDKRAKCYIGIINSKKDIEKTDKNGIITITGRKLYKLITGSESAYDDILAKISEVCAKISPKDK